MRPSDVPQSVPSAFAWGKVIWAERVIGGDLDTVFRRIYGVSRLQGAREVWRVDAGEYGTIIAYDGVGMRKPIVRYHLFGHAEIRE
jgi:hypothetical protein